MRQIYGYLVMFGGLTGALLLTALPFLIGSRLGWGLKRRRRRELKGYVDQLLVQLGRPERRFRSPCGLRRTIHKRQGAEAALPRLLEAVFRHMGLGGDVHLTVVHSAFDSFSGAHRAGQFTPYDTPEIELLLKPDPGFFTIAAILAPVGAAGGCSEKRLDAGRRRGVRHTAGNFY